MKSLDELANEFKLQNESVLTDERGIYLPGTPIASFKAGYAARDAEVAEKDKRIATLEATVKLQEQEWE